MRSQFQMAPSSFRHVTLSHNICSTIMTSIFPTRWRFRVACRMCTVVIPLDTFDLGVKADKAFLEMKPTFFK